jgi:hypothetical protein
MTFRVRIDLVAQRQIDDFAVYLRNYSEEFAIEQIDRLDRIMSVNLGESPLTWAYFAFTGAPYRAYLFRVGRRTNTGSYTPSTRRAEQSTSSIFGMLLAIRTRWICKSFSRAIRAKSRVYACLPSSAGFLDHVLKVEFLTAGNNTASSLRALRSPSRRFIDGRRRPAPRGSRARPCASPRRRTASARSAPR